MLDSERSHFATAIPGTRAAPIPTLMLSRRDIAALMQPRDHLAAVEAGFRSYATGVVDVPPPLHLRANEGVAQRVGTSFAFGAL